MIDKATALAAVLQRLAALPVGHALEIRTYKRNRGALFVRLAEGRWRLAEQGYADSDGEVAAADLRKAVKALLAREFPRSTKIRLYNLGPHRAELEGLARKTL